MKAKKKNAFRKVYEKIYLTLQNKKKEDELESPLVKPLRIVKKSKNLRDRIKRVTPNL